MWMLGFGILQIVLYWAGVGPMAKWNWDITGDLWKFMWPFAATIVWWTWADQSGYNKRRIMEREEARKHARRVQHLSATGVSGKSRSSKKP